jgi:long-chain acyl-CoA synthetase
MGDGQFMERVWERHYPAGLSWSDPLPPAFALEGVLVYAAHVWPQRTAIDFYDRRISYKELWDLVRNAAYGLQSLGVGPGVHVALHLQNSPHFIVFFFATLLAGGRVVSFNPLCGLTELDEKLEDSEARILVTADWQPSFPDLHQLRRLGNIDCVVVCRLKDFIVPTLAAQLAKPLVRRERTGRKEMDFIRLLMNDGLVVRHPRGDLTQEVAVLQYTGGTTGEPKGAMLTHANFAAVMNILARTAAAAQPGMAALPAELAPVQRVLGVLPLFHIYGLNSIMLPTLAAGNELVLHIRFEAGRVLADITRKRINAFSAVPAMHLALASHPDFSTTDFTSLLAVGSGGAPLPLAVREQFELSTERILGEGYALTETTGLGTLPLLAARVARAGQVGLPAPRTLVEVVDLETGLNVLPPGETGEICFTGPQVMQGYWKRAQENQEVFRGGRFHTGDIGYIDAEGGVVLSERKKDMILVSGQNVYPGNIERAIYEHPDVMEVAVVGVASSQFGQVAKAFVVLKPQRPAFTYRELCTFLTKRLASYEIPMALEFRDALPKTPIGKIAKHQLVDEPAAMRAAPVSA